MNFQLTSLSFSLFQGRSTLPVRTKPRAKAFLIGQTPSATKIDTNSTQRPQNPYKSRPQPMSSTNTAVNSLSLQYNPRTVDGENEYSVSLLFGIHAPQNAVPASTSPQLPHPPTLPRVPDPPTLPEFSPVLFKNNDPSQISQTNNLSILSSLQNPDVLDHQIPNQPINSPFATNDPTQPLTPLSTPPTPPFVQTQQPTAHDLHKTRKDLRPSSSSSGTNSIAVVKAFPASPQPSPSIHPLVRSISHHHISRCQSPTISSASSNLHAPSIAASSDSNQRIIASFENTEDYIANHQLRSAPATLQHINNFYASIPVTNSATFHNNNSPLERSQPAFCGQQGYDNDSAANRSSNNDNPSTAPFQATYSLSTAPTQRSGEQRLLPSNSPLQPNASIQTALSSAPSLSNRHNYQQGRGEMRAYDNKQRQSHRPHQPYQQYQQYQLNQHPSPHAPPTSHTSHSNRLHYCAAETAPFVPTTYQHWTSKTSPSFENQRHSIADHSATHSDLHNPQDHSAHLSPILPGPLSQHLSNPANSVGYSALDYFPTPSQPTPSLNAQTDSQKPSFGRAAAVSPDTRKATNATLQQVRLRTPSSRSNWIQQQPPMHQQQQQTPSQTPDSDSLPQFSDSL